MKPSCWLPDTVRDCECAIWHRKERSNQSDVCDRCVKLKWQLVACKKSHDELSPSEKLQCQSASSNYPFEYLSPQSKKIKLGHLHQSLTDIRKKASKKAEMVDRQCMIDAQSEEISRSFIPFN